MGRSASHATKILKAAQQLADELDAIDFSEAVEWVYNPFRYAYESYAAYVKLAVTGPRSVFFLGMNPGPWGMAQTGVPFGEVAAVKEWLQIDAPVSKPDREHPKRPIEGLACKKSEVSGRRFWGLMRDRFETPQAFFENHFVSNYCPLAFMSETGANITPDKLPVSLRAQIETHCDHHLQVLLEVLEPEWMIGIGGFAEQCFHRCDPKEGKVGRILHPSPASPVANRDWAGTAISQMVKQKVWKD